MYLLKVIIVISVTSFGIKEPEDEWLCKAVLILINIYIETLDIILKQISNTPTTALHKMGTCPGFQKPTGR